MSAPFPPLAKGALACLLALGVLLGWEAAARTDRNLRADLVRQARILKAGMVPERLQELSGDPGALEERNQLHIRKQLLAYRDGSPGLHRVLLAAPGRDGQG